MFVAYDDFILEKTQKEAAINGAAGEKATPLASTISLVKPDDGSLPSSSIKAEKETASALKKRIEDRTREINQLTANVCYGY